MKTFLILFSATALFAQQVPESEPPAKGETLRYNVNWPSGLSLGEAELSSSPVETGLSFSFHLDVSVPGFAVTESGKSLATTEFCSTELHKSGTRGKRKVDERTEFDSGKMQAIRTTEGGGKSEMSTPACAKDALTFIHFLRRELASGRLPPQQKVYYGSGYSVQVTFVGTQRITVSGQQVDADKLLAVIKGPATEVNAELFFSKDEKRTPLMIQIPLVVGKFSVELDR